MVLGVRLLLDPDGDGLDVEVAELVAQSCDGTIRPEVSRQAGERLTRGQRARKAALHDVTVIVRHRRSRPLVDVDLSSTTSTALGRLVAGSLRAGIVANAQHEVLGEATKIARERPVLIVRPQEGTPPWRSAAAILGALRRWAAG